MALYVIGNGFSINVVRKLEETEVLQRDRIDLTNLFSKSDSIPAEYGDGCYLSKNSCPNLWNLGLRCITDKKISSRIINNIISSYVLYLKKCEYRNKYNPTSANEMVFDQNHESVKTYYELNRYLKKLIIFYDHTILDAVNKLGEIHRINFLDGIPFINTIEEGDVIVSYNYDIFLERLLSLVGKSYTYVFKMEDVDEKKINIYKPHGSINFEAKKNIANIYDLKPNQIRVVNELEEKFNGSLIVPPTGSIIGQKGSWIRNIREMLSETLINNIQDKAYFYGLSYDVADREEINEILCCLDKNTTQIIYIDPSPSPNLDYIITQNFDLYCHKKP